MPLGGPGIGDMGVTGRSGVVALLLPIKIARTSIAQGQEGSAILVETY